MKIIVNGDELELPGRVATLAEALEALDYGGATVATAVNGHFVATRLRNETPIAEGDKLEIVAPRQGG